MNQHKWSLPSRMMVPKCTRPTTLFNSGGITLSPNIQDTIGLSFCQGQLRIMLKGRTALKYCNIPMKDDDPIFPYIVLYDAGDSARIVTYDSELIRFAKANR